MRIPPPKSRNGSRLVSAQVFHTLCYDWERDRGFQSWDLLQECATTVSEILQSLLAISNTLGDPKCRFISCRIETSALHSHRKWTLTTRFSTDVLVSAVPYLGPIKLYTYSATSN